MAHGWKPAVKIIYKHLIILLCLNILAALLIAKMGPIFGFSQKMNTLQIGLNALTKPYGADSWQPMKLAWDYWTDNNKAVQIYSDLLIRDNIKFQYPPNTLLIIKLLSAIAVDPSLFFTLVTRIFLVVTILAVTAVALLSIKSFGISVDSLAEKALLVILIALLTLTFYPIIKACVLGQSQAWLNGLFAVALVCYMTGNMTLAGLIIGLMSSIKPQYGLFLIWGIIRGNWRLSGAIVIGAGVSVLLGISEFGISIYLDYLKGLGFLSKHGESYMANQTVNGLINRIFSISDPESYNNDYWRRRAYPPYNPWVYYGTLISSLIIVAICFMDGRNKKGYSSYADFCLMALGATLASPIAWEHHYGIMLPIFALLWPLFWIGKTRFNTIRSQVIFLGLYLISSNTIPFINFLAPTYFNFLQSYLFFAAVGMFVFLVKVRQSEVELPAAFVATG